MEKELKDMTKEEMDALINENYQNHQKLWLTIDDILDERPPQIHGALDTIVLLVTLHVNSFLFRTITSVIANHLAQDSVLLLRVLVVIPAIHFKSS